MGLDLTDPKLGTTVGDGYRLDERLGAGGMGVVYKGEQVVEGRRVAVKFLHDAFAGVPDLVKRFQREVQAMSRVRHPNLVTILDSGVAAGVPFLVMDFLLGKSLGDVLERGALPPARGLRIARQILAGVSAAHDSGVVHRDLKPDNLLLVGSDEDECVKILDFGLAKMLHEAGTHLTNTGLALGTPAYMSPEQARGTATDHRSDLYSVGVILYQLLVGKKPFVAESPMTVMRMHMEEPPVPPRQAAPDARISPAMERVILRAMEKDPEARWQTAAEFLRALDATPEGTGRTVAPVGRRLPWRRLAQLGLALTVVGAALVGWRQLSHREQQQVKNMPQQVRHVIGGAVDKAKDVMRAVPALPSVKPAPDSDESDDNDDLAPPRDTPGARQEAATPTTEAKKPKLQDAVRLITAGKPDEGVTLLYQLRRKSPDSPAVALWLGHAYFKKLWRTDGLREYQAALEESPSLRRDGQLIRNAVAALDDPTYRLARGLLRKRVGAAALGELRRAARDGKNPKVQSRAARLAGELAHRHR